MYVCVLHHFLIIKTEVHPSILLFLFLRQVHDNPINFGVHCGSKHTYIYIPFILELKVDDIQSNVNKNDCYSDKNSESVDCLGVSYTALYCEFIGN